MTMNVCECMGMGTCMNVNKSEHTGGGICVNVKECHYVTCMSRDESA